MLDEEMRSTYLQMLGENGPNARALGWASTDRQQARFSVLLQANLTNVQSVLDVGSGLGDLIPHLRFAKARLTDYLGVEAMPEFVKYAQDAYPHYNFHEGDVREMEVLPKYDLVVSSGVFGWQPIAVCFELLDLMWSHTKRVMAFNFSHITSPLRDRHLLDFAGKADGGYVLRNDYLDGNDFTVYMYRGNNG